MIISPDAPNAALLERIERFYDAVPRSGARAEDFGPLSLFVREGAGWPYYARPALGASAGVTAADVDRVRTRQRELGVPEAFEWTAETAPALRAAVEESGLRVNEHPLMVLDTDTVPAAEDGPDGVEVRLLPGGDPLLAASMAVAHLAFGEPGTAIGSAGAGELAAAVEAAEADGTAQRLTGRIEAGLSAVAVALAADGALLGSGQHQWVGEVSELVGIGTLPVARRRGVGRALTARLAADARAKGATTVFLTASDEAVARVYASAGFRRIATALIAEPA
ncbi:GNAT family N-acetyltransferase [Kitasatospora terrestris]|uniref:N-acetyltransferase domain-containing protein n=1 Tax=Kitasatospora terrestris TaxID=258051 RepID=A0ABP9EMK3_9ACTN